MFISMFLHHVYIKVEYICCCKAKTLLAFEQINPQTFNFLEESKMPSLSELIF